MLVRLTAIACAVVFVATACGGSSRRDAVNDYITQVNLIEDQLQRPLLEISKANRDFARGHSTQSVLSKLQRSGRTLRKLDRRLAALPAPREARRLRALLLELGAREEALVREVEALAVFLPKFQDALAPLAPASTELKHSLAGKSTLAAKIAALDQYVFRVEVVVARLRPLTPPPSSRPVWSQQIETLERIRTSAAALADALRKKRAKEVPKLLHAFDVAAVSNESAKAQRARIAAVVAYNGRIKRLSLLAAAIGREENRLQATLD